MGFFSGCCWSETGCGDVPSAIKGYRPGGYILPRFAYKAVFLPKKGPPLLSGSPLSSIGIGDIIPTSWVSCLIWSDWSINTVNRPAVCKHVQGSAFYPTGIGRSFVFPTGDISKTVFWDNSKMWYSKESRSQLKSQLSILIICSVSFILNPV